MPRINLLSEVEETVITNGSWTGGDLNPIVATIVNVSGK